MAPLSPTLALAALLLSPIPTELSPEPPAEDRLRAALAEQKTYEILRLKRLTEERDAQKKREAKDLDELSLGTNGPFEMSPQHTDRGASLLGIERLVHGATVSTCSGTQSRAEGIAAQSGAQIESMEGAAVAFACRQADVPLVQLRCVSNFAGDRAEGSWDIEGSTTILQSAVRQLARGLTP